MPEASNFLISCGVCERVIVCVIVLICLLVYVYVCVCMCVYGRVVRLYECVVVVCYVCAWYA